MVKYAESPSASVEVSIAAAPAVVWPLLCDIELPAQFSEEFQRAEWTSDGPAVGATFQGYNKHPAVGEWDVTCTVTVFEPEQSFGWRVGDEGTPAAQWRVDLSEADGGSHLRFSATMGPGPSGLTPAIERMPDREDEIVDSRLGEWTANMQRTVDGIAGLAEAAS